MMNPTDALLVFVAAFGAGVMNAIAGGGTFLTLPMLIYVGIPAKAANATSTVALWPGNVASTLGYWPELQSQSGRGVFFATSLFGGMLGAFLLMATGEATFRLMIPWLMLVATALFAAGPLITRRLRGDQPAPRQSHRTRAPAVLAQFIIAIYGGYFGAGIGILMLAALALSGMEDIHQMNGLKNGLATAIKGTAVFTFIAMDLLPAPDFVPWEDQNILVWPEMIVMIVGSIAGGIAGVKLAKRLPTRLTRGIIITVGAVLTAAFFYKIYGTP